jgi:Pyrimidine dimer DNA glycosylase
MITYMTRKSIGQTAADLDVITLGQQREEALKLLDVMTGVKEEEPHPMIWGWAGYEYFLGIYGMMLSMEWHMNRGFADKMFWDFERACKELKRGEPDTNLMPPPWFKDVAILRSHRSALYRRNPDYYGELWSVLDDDWPILWPVIDDSDEGYHLVISKDDKAKLISRDRSLPKDVLARVANV